MRIFFIDISCALFLISATAATIIISLTKWQVLTWYQVHVAKRVIAGVRMPDSVCIFCLGFWISAALVGLLFISIQLSAWYLLIPFPSASITRLIYENAVPKER